MQDEIIALEQIVAEMFNIVVGASYDDDSKDKKGNPIRDKDRRILAVDELVERKYMAEAALGRPFPQHYILRDGDKNKDRLKFTLNLMGVPVIAYMMMSIMKSDAKGRVAIVGNNHVRAIVEKFNEHYKPTQFGNEFVFVDEGAPMEWSLENTLKKGTDAFEEKDKKVIFLNGDLPTFFDINSLIYDPDASKYSAVVDLNSAGKMFGSKFWVYGEADKGFFPRNYHMVFSKWFVFREYVKESNMYVFDYKKAEPWIDLIYEGRKSASGQNKKAFSKMLFGTWERAKKSALAFATSPFIAFTNAAKFWLKERFISKYGFAPLPAREHTLLKYRIPKGISGKLASIALGAPVKIKAEHRDAARLMDIDSWQDWSFVNSMLHTADNPSDVYPYWGELKEFAQYEQEFVDSGIAMMDKGYINSQFSLYNGLKDRKPFGKEGNFRNTLWDDERIKKGIDDRKRYIAGCRQRNESRQQAA